MTETRLESTSSEEVSGAADRKAGGGTTEETAVAVENLRKVYGSSDGEVEAVKGVSFDIEPGTAVGILGPNGAGKTTTIKSLLSLIVPTEGSVHVDGIDVHDDTKAAFQRMGAVLEGARNIYWRLTVRENMRFFSGVAGKNPNKLSDRYETLLSQFGIAEKADTVVRELSRGQKQKVSLACTMARDADVVFLDEPTLGLDVESSLELRNELRNLVEDDGTTVLLSSHDMDVIEDVCDRVIIMNDGRVIADDTVENLLSLFDTQVYEIVVESVLDDDLRRQLRSSFDVEDFENRGENTSFQVQITGDGIYELVETLRTAGASIEAINTAEPDLEEVFLRITDEDGRDIDDAEQIAGGKVSADD